MEVKGHSSSMNERMRERRKRHLRTTVRLLAICNNGKGNIYGSSDNFLPPALSPVKGCGLSLISYRYCSVFYLDDGEIALDLVRVLWAGPS